MNKVFQVGKLTSSALKIFEKASEKMHQSSLYKSQTIPQKAKLYIEIVIYHMWNGWKFKYSLNF